MVYIAQINVNNQSRTSLSESTISLNLKFCSLARGAFAGNRACMKAFSVSVNQLAVSGTDNLVLASTVYWVETTHNLEEETTLRCRRLPLQLPP